MNKYTIYCTESQTRRAMELGAPIEYQLQGIFKVPTSEQMISWLEGRDIFININHIGAGYGSWVKTISTNENIGKNLGYVTTRKEATHAAIDAALEYLKNTKYRKK